MPASSAPIRRIQASRSQSGGAAGAVTTRPSWPTAATAAPTASSPDLVRDHQDRQVRVGLVAERRDGVEAGGRGPSRTGRRP